jgi:hypothetical protein
MDITLTDIESKFYDRLFLLVDVEKVGKLSKLKVDEFLRSTDTENDILINVSMNTKKRYKLPFDFAQFHNSPLIFVHLACVTARVRLDGGRSTCFRI